MLQEDFYEFPIYDYYAYVKQSQIKTNKFNNYYILNIELTLYFIRITKLILNISSVSNIKQLEQTNLIKMSNQTSLKYQIGQLKQIRGQGSIANITNLTLNKSFKLISNTDDEFRLELKLTKPSIITQIKFRLIDVQQYEIKFRKFNKQIVWQNRANAKAQKYCIKIQKSQTTNIVQIILRNNIHNPKRMGINYVILEGFNDQTKQAQKTNIKKSKKQQQLIIPLQVYDYTVKRKTDNSKEMFQSRLKQGKYTQAKQVDLRKKLKLNQENQKTQRQIRKIIRQSKQKKQKEQKQQQQTQLALALSRSQKIQNNIDQQIQKIDQEHMVSDVQIPQALRQYGQCIERVQQYEQRQYDIIDKDEQKLNHFSCLNSKWLQAQRKAQQQANVRQNQRLSNYINLKHLYRVEVYVDGFPEWQNEEIKINADKLGCKIIKELKSNCFVFLSKELIQKTRKKYKHLTGLKYLRSQYLQACIKQRKRLNPTDFYYKI